jgi:GNAT superfamily N-acetyltransferase
MVLAIIARCGSPEGATRSSAVPTALIERGCNPRFDPIQSRQRALSLQHQEFLSVAQADIIIADEKLLPQAVELYNQIFRPKHDLDYFKRRFLGRYNILTLIARLDDRPVGFWMGFELKPAMFYQWLGAVVPDLRRHGIARQMQDAQQAWAKDHGYEYIRCECMNHQREFIHFAIDVGYDIIGTRWDSTHADNLINFEKNLID